MKAAETGVCDVEGNCLCSGELEDPGKIFDYSPDDDDNTGDVGVGICIDHMKLNIFLPGVASLLEKIHFPAAQSFIHFPISK